MNAPREFPDSPVVVDNLGDPATDPLLTTVRMQPPDTQARRLDPRTVRVVKLDNGGLGWREVGDHTEDMANPWRTDAEVRDWIIQDPITLGVAMDRGAGITPPPPASRPVELVGDMGVEVFKGDTQ